MSLPNVNIKLGNGNLGRVAQSNDGVAGLVVNVLGNLGTSLELLKPYQLSSPRDLEKLGITSSNEKIIVKEVEAFYSQAGEGAELHLMAVSNATLAVDMVDLAFENLVRPLGGRIKILGLCVAPSVESESELIKGISKDVVDASLKCQTLADTYASKYVMPLRVIMNVFEWDEDATELYEPRKSACNRVSFVMADDKTSDKCFTVVGLVLGRAAKVEPQQSLGRVKDGPIASELWPAGEPIVEKLHDAGYIVPTKYPTKNGVYLNGCPTAAPVTDDYSELNLGRIIDKAHVICYDTYISEILDNIQVDEKGQIPTGVCKSFEGMIENAIGIAMNGQISGFKAYVDPAQNVLSSGTLAINCSITPLGTLQNINVNLSFTNPALNQ